MFKVIRKLLSAFEAGLMTEQELCQALHVYQLFP